MNDKLAHPYLSFETPQKPSCLHFSFERDRDIRQLENTSMSDSTLNITDVYHSLRDNGLIISALDLVEFGDQTIELA